MSQTPETDAMSRRLPFDNYSAAIQATEFARKLERERDDARFELAMARIPTTVDAVEREEWRQERDQLRSVCDELAQRVRLRSRISERTFAGYNSLPHVKARQ